MLPYLEIPIYIGYGEVEPKIVMVKVQPDRIDAYHEGYEPETGSFLYVNGQPLQTTLSVADIENQIKSYWSLITTGNRLKVIK